MSHIPSLPGKAEVAQVLRGTLSDLPSLPEVALRLAEVTRDQKGSVTDLTKLVETDPAMMARLLRLVNSPAYGFPRKISSLRESIVILGFDAIRRLALGMTMHDNLMKASSGTLFDQQVFWRHCLAVAAIARELAEVTGEINPEEAYVAGLLHDLGKPVLEQFGILSYSDFLDYVHDKPGLLIEEERKILGQGHDVMGALFATHSGLPKRLVHAIQLHHHPLPESVERSTALLTALVALADFVSWSHGFGSVPQSRPPILPPYVAKLIDLEKLDLTSLVRSMDREVTVAADFYHFSFPVPSELRENLLGINLVLGRMNSSLYYTKDQVTSSPSPHEETPSRPRQDTLLVPHHSLNQESIIDDTLSAIRTDLELDRVCLLLLEPAKRRLRLVTCRDHTDRPVGPSNRTVSLGEEAGELLACLRSRRSRTIAGQGADRNALLAILGIETLSLVPVMGQHRVIGLIGLDNASSGRPVKPGTMEAASLVAHELGLALEYARLLAQSRRQAEKDALTGLPNRAALDASLANEVDHAHEQGQPLAAAMLDIDHFKRFNDTYGHATGDTMLKLIGKVLRQVTREGNIVGRYGGEEFTTVLPGVTKSNAFDYCERLRMAIEQMGRRLEQRFPGHPLTVSIGLAMLGSDDSAESLLGRADEALYRAKRSGRNRVEADKKQS